MAGRGWLLRSRRIALGTCPFVEWCEGRCRSPAHPNGRATLNMLFQLQLSNVTRGFGHVSNSRSGELVGRRHPCLPHPMALHENARSTGPRSRRAAASPADPRDHPTRGHKRLGSKSDGRGHWRGTLLQKSSLPSAGRPDAGHIWPSAF